MSIAATDGFSTVVAAALAEQETTADRRPSPPRHYPGGTVRVITLATPARRGDPKSPTETEWDAHAWPLPSRQLRENRPNSLKPARKRTSLGVLERRVMVGLWKDERAGAHLCLRSRRW